MYISTYFLVKIIDFKDNKDVFKDANKQIIENKKKRPATKRKKYAVEIQEPIANGNVTVYNFGQVSLNI
jgi:hypothetical protein